MENQERFEVEEIGPGRLRVSIDGDPIEVTVETTFSSHHHFGRFSQLDQLVAIVRTHRREQRDAEVEIERLRNERGED